MSSDTTDAMMEVTFDSGTPAHRQQHLPKWEQRLNSLKSVILRKILNGLTLFSGFYSSTSVLLFLLIEVYKHGMWFLCLKVHPEKGLGPHLDSQYPVLLPDG